MVHSTLALNLELLERCPSAIAGDDLHELISSRRVDGTAVYDPAEHRIGSIHSLMVEKCSGRVVYALLEFGGVLGFARRVYPIPWEKLTYDVNLDGYSVDLDHRELERAPTLHLDEGDRPKRDELDEEANPYGDGKLNWFGL